MVTSRKGFCVKVTAAIFRNGDNVLLMPPGYSHSPANGWSAPRRISRTLSPFLKIAAVTFTLNPFLYNTILHCFFGFVKPLFSADFSVYT